MRFLIHIIILFIAFCYLLGESHANEKTITIQGNFVVIYGEMTEGIADIVIEEFELYFLNNPNKKCYLIINSIGGYFIEAEKIANYINTNKNIEVIVQKAFSSAELLTHLYSGRRYIVKNGHMMQHDAFYHYSDNLTIHKLRELTDSLQKFLDYLHPKIAKRLKISRLLYETLIRDDWECRDHHCVRTNRADEVVNLKFLKTDYTKVYKTWEKPVKSKKTRSLKW